MHQLQLVSLSPCSIFFLVLVSFDFHSYVCQDGKVHNSAASLFIVNNYKVRSSGQDLMIFLHLKNPENFMRLIFQDGFLLVRIPFGSKVMFKLLAHFLVAHLPHSIVFSLILFLWLLFILCNYYCHYYYYNRITKVYLRTNCCYHIYIYIYIYCVCVWLVKCCHLKSLISRMRFQCFRVVVFLLGSKKSQFRSVSKKITIIMHFSSPEIWKLYCLPFMSEARIRTFHYVLVSIWG